MTPFFQVQKFAIANFVKRPQNDPTKLALNAFFPFKISFNAFGASKSLSKTFQKPLEPLNHSQSSFKALRAAKSLSKPFQSVLSSKIALQSPFKAFGAAKSLSNLFQKPLEPQNRFQSPFKAFGDAKSLSNLFQSLSSRKIPSKPLSTLKICSQTGFPLKIFIPQR